jgi:hypothetical protein
MKYALLIYPARAAYSSLSDDELKTMTGEYVQLTKDEGVYATEQLEAAETATTVRSEGGRTLITDGPYANTKEVVGGFYLLDVENLDAALEFAARIPAVRIGGAVEVHRVAER